MTKDSFELFCKYDAYYCICKPTDPFKLTNILNLIFASIIEVKGLSNIIK